ncbi:D-sedoheptulose 7-phosphate isomerase [Paracraurococcus ruber]|uniref:Phosphoheptose isomerase n=1 Tax=Paracraurococcus ruber TaxID=77675 RepID=A0ABS1CRN4_9PROT|nr:D-sedoheptulose 7-phosphate isomerase [Paracraurococcus ruber]MBK1656941.1 phosphoheptose isomerase [Paracraurococcus ruber]TDG34264.1 SIS domain-containing protein [Paracraurococcus ruber]
MSEAIREAVLDAAATLRRLAEDAAALAAIGGIVDLCVEALSAGRKLLLCGNGGSAADAQHWAAELVSRFHYDRPGLAAIALTTDSSILTGIGNDYGYDRVFARQVEALGAPGDVLFALSTSGRSDNVLAALRAARAKGLATVGFTGAGGGEMPALCDILLRAPSDATPRIQEAHEVAGHIICAMVERRMFPPSA